jgi:hypothetical protein
VGRFWTGIAFVRDCEGLVAAVDQVFVAGHHLGYRVLQQADDVTPSDIEFIPSGRVSLVCADGIINAVLQPSRSEIIVQRFSRDRELLQTLKLELADAAEFGSAAPFLWRTTVENQKLIQVAEQRDDRSILRRHTYAIALDPPRAR